MAGLSELALRKATRQPRSCMRSRRLTLHQVWRRAQDPRGGAALIEAHRATMHEGDAITDAALRHSFLTLIPENREIAALWQQAGGAG